MQINGKTYNLLLVDDTPENLRFLATTLSNEGYKIRVAPSGELALTMIQEDLPHLILLDIDMPFMNGYQVCERIKANFETKTIPIIFLSALSANHAKVEAFQRGGVDYVTKPFQIDELLARISTHLELNELRAELQKNNEVLSKMVNEQFFEIQTAQLTTIYALIKLSESRDDDTGKHIDRVGNYALCLTKAARESTQFNYQIDDQFELDIYHAAAMHDVGKVGISDSILLKPGKLLPDEFEMIKQHTTIGNNTLTAILESYPQNHMLALGAEVAYCHHEKWDGNGYPRSLKGQEIPLSARIVAIADVYDALRSKRPYKQPFSHEQAMKFLEEGSGTHFDPDLIHIVQLTAYEFNRTWSAYQ